MPTHVCGQCNKQFTSDEGYLNHTCESTGFTPKDPDHQGPEFKAISEAALARGEARKNPSEKPEPQPEPAPSASPQPTQEEPVQSERLVVEEIPGEPTAEDLSEKEILAAVRAARNAKKP